MWGLAISLTLRRYYFLMLLIILVILIKLVHILRNSWAKEDVGSI